MLRSWNDVYTGAISHLVHENLIFQRSKSGGGLAEKCHDESLTLSILEASSGFEGSSIQIHNYFKFDCHKFLVSGQHAVYYDPQHSCYSALDTLNNQACVNAPRIFKTPHKFITHCCSTLSDNVFIYVYRNISNNEIIFDILTIHNGTIKLQSVLHFEKISASAFPGTENSKTKKISVINIHPHPSQQSVFVVYSSGSVQVQKIGAYI